MIQAVYYMGKAFFFEMVCYSIFTRGFLCQQIELPLKGTRKSSLQVP